MNIFILDRDPIKCAKYHCDKHVVKMVTESLQIMGSNMWFQNGIFTKKQIPELNSEVQDIWSNFPRTSSDGKISPYGIGYMHHPCTKWARESKENWDWLLELTLNLSLEHEQRYGKVTMSRKIAEWFSKNYEAPVSKGLTEFYQAVPEELKGPDPVHAYRLYYAGWKEYFAKWKNEVPEWWGKYLHLSVKNDLMNDRVKERFEKSLQSSLIYKEKSIE